MGKRSKAIGNLQPKGKPLYEQEKSSFGSRMLSKMGWEAGKGLGTHLQGNPEFVRIKYKSDADGLGYEDRNDQWTQNEEGFNKLLNSLNQQTDSNEIPKPLKSLEEKSKHSRVRVHYQKRIACKDLSKRSAKDLANIFGKKSLTEEPNTEEKNGSQDSTDSNEANTTIYETNTIKATMSSADYFKSKYQNKKMKIVENDEPWKNNVEEMETRTQFKQASDEETTKVEQKKEKKSKKKRKASVDAEPSEIAEVPPKAKKAKKRKIETSTAEAEAAAPPIPEPKPKSKKSSVSPCIICSNAAYTNDDVEQTVISVDRFAVDKLNFLDLETFGFSNVANIIGYGLTENLNINLLNCQTLQNAKCNKYELYYLMDRKMSQKNINSKMKAKKAVFVPI